MELAHFPPLAFITSYVVKTVILLQLEKIQEAQSNKAGEIRIQSAQLPIISITSSFCTGREKIFIVAPKLWYLSESDPFGNHESQGAFREEAKHT